MFFQLHELNVGGGGDTLPASTYFILILNTNFEECSSILTVIFSKL